MSEDGNTRSNLAFGEVLMSLRRWAPGFLRTRLATRWRRCANQDSQDLIEDAIQHLMIVLAAGKARALLTEDDVVLLAWCKRVLLNYVLSELRRGARESNSEALSTVLGPICPPPEHAVGIRLAVERLVSGLRGEVRRSARPQNAELRLGLLDDFLLGALGGCEDKTGAALDNRTLKRRSRGRRVAQSAWYSLRERDGYGELHDVAEALGLGQPINASGSEGPVSFLPRKCQPRTALAS